MKQGISFTVLVITIIIMIILSITVISTLGNMRILDTVNNTVDLQNLQNEKLQLELIMVDVILKNDGGDLLDSYIAELKSNGLIHDEVKVGLDGSKTVITKSGYGVRIEKVGEDDLKITVEGKLEGLGVEVEKVDVEATTNKMVIAVTLKKGMNVEYSYYYRVQGESTYKLAGTTEESTYEIEVVAKNAYGTSISHASARTGEITSAVGKITLKTLTWVNGKADLIVQKASDVSSEFTIEYSIDDGENYFPTTGSITQVQSGTTVLVRLTDGYNSGETLSIEVIDSIAPKVQISVGEITDTKLKLNVTTEEFGSGVKTYRYYIKEHKATAYTLVSTTSSSTTYTYNVEAKKEYDVKVEVEDGGANVGTESIIDIAVIPTEWRANVTDIEDGVPIPKGFTVSKATNEKTKERGLVIYEGSMTVTDDNLYYAKRNINQYVWVPVADFSKFVRKDFGLGDTISETLGTKFSEVERNVTTNMPLSKEETSDYKADGKLDCISETTILEAQAMYESVKKYGGFYIGRYEAGIDNSRKYDEMDTNILKGSSIYSRMNKYPYNNIRACKGADGNPGVDEGGAIEAARSIYTNNNNTYGVVSTLTYSVQWDATLQWWLDSAAVTGVDTNASVSYGNMLGSTISAGGFNEGSKYTTAHIKSGGNWEYTTNTLTKTNTQPMLLTTGAIEVAKVNNIYDMSGNLYEWTMEIYLTLFYQRRGGYFQSDKSVASRSTYYPSEDSYFVVGFRPSLYIK